MSGLLIIDRKVIDILRQQIGYYRQAPSCGTCSFFTAHNLTCRVLENINCLLPTTGGGYCAHYKCAGKFNQAGQQVDAEVPPARPPLSEITLAVPAPVTNDPPSNSTGDETPAEEPHADGQS